MKDEYVINPITGRKIKKNGETHKRLKSSGIRTRKCPNKYPNLPASDFCGEAGGACKRMYPVNTSGRARSALAYARYAPNPVGIKKCVYKRAAKEGWFEK